jgi:hypothetical protein
LVYLRLSMKSASPSKARCESEMVGHQQMRVFDLRVMRSDLVQEQANQNGEIGSEHDAAKPVDFLFATNDCLFKPNRICTLLCLAYTKAPLGTVGTASEVCEQQCPRLCPHSLRRPHPRQRPS